MFEPISVRKYLELYIESNTSERRNDLEERLRDVLGMVLSGRKWGCGNPIWAVGGAEAGYYCFTYITGETVPDEDYEIDGFWQ
ncbi:hypothetical protein ACVWYN_003659 [Pedobacter sp. UYP24]